ncbi:ABC transporter ATP-binding protein [Thermofilum pendens]|uniref:Oligopeptide/dipeptide ABC transporter, ATPase subunit n=1 Tax=Thermofilum pendens (strain DSM 2475 / Hrk 5) TaxID=368408 RepID=A1S0P9_THEPD|nr:ABC transporter ATP-binding protein [Thermofilum pendens]ABL79029.1 oligopeptide/dipeptide ABC transporter, ATPase subunit [Thermofilum pendens Hrk 5]
MSHATTRELLVVEDLRVYFPVRRTLGEILRGRQRLLRAVDGVSFSLRSGEIMALVGESGSGKTTVARAVVGLVKPTSGRILFDGRDISRLDGRELRSYRRSVQMVFQDPSVSLNPRMKVGEQVKYPLDVNKVGSEDERREAALKALERVGLVPPEDFYSRYPHQLSGGQRQRVAIARALVLNPRLLLADEPISNVDVSARAQILALLKSLRDERSLSILYITHDLSSAWAIADSVAVMYLGKLVEAGPVQEVFSNPLHPYTKALLSAVPSLTPGGAARRRVTLKGEIPSPLNPPAGCRLHPRCPFATEKCRAEEPALAEAGKGHLVACHLYATP